LGTAVLVGWAPPRPAATRKTPPTADQVMAMINGCKVKDRADLENRKDALQNERTVRTMAALLAKQHKSSGDHSLVQQIDIQLADKVREFVGTREAAVKLLEELKIDVAMDVVTREEIERTIDSGDGKELEGKGFVMKWFNDVNGRTCRWPCKVILQKITLVGTVTAAGEVELVLASGAKKSFPVVDSAIKIKLGTTNWTLTANFKDKNSGDTVTWDFASRPEEVKTKTVCTVELCGNAGTLEDVDAREMLRARVASDVDILPKPRPESMPMFNEDEPFLTTKEEYELWKKSAKGRKMAPDGPVVVDPNWQFGDVEIRNNYFDEHTSGANGGTALHVVNIFCQSCDIDIVQ
jgi:hypothetical protein